LAQTCRAYNLQCETCQKMGHVKQVCRAGRQRNTAPQRVPQQYQQQQYSQPVQQQYAQQVPPQQQPQYQQSAQPQPAVQRQQVNINGKIQCYQCGQYGHMQRSCPRLNNQVHCVEEQYEQEYHDDQGNQAEQLQASLRKQYQEYDRQNYINITGNHDDVEYEEYIPPMRDYPRPDEPRKGKAYLTKMLQKWDWTQVDTHDEAIAVLQDERMQDEQQLIHQSLTQLGANWGRTLPMYPVRFRTTDGQMKIITIGADDTGSDLIKNANAFYGKWLDKVKYHGQDINEKVTVLENGLIPGWSNILEVTYKPEMVVNAQGVCSLQKVMPQVRVYANEIPDRLTHELSQRRINHDNISEILQEVINLSIPAESLARIVDKLRTFAADKILPYQVEVYTILKKYGQYLRKQIRKKKYKEIAIGITTYDGIRLRCVLPSHAKVRELRNEVKHKLNSPLMVHLELLMTTSI